MEQTPQSLLEKLRLRPDDASWKRLVNLYTPLLQRWLHQYGIPPADADDLVQEVLTVLVRELPAFQHTGHRGAFRRWLRTVVVHRVQGYRRSRQVSSAAVLHVSEGELSAVADPAGGLEQQWEQEHDQYLIRRALELLEKEFTPTTCQAFRRQVLDAASPAAVAAELGMTANAVVLAKFRVLRRLRRELDGLTD
jgi:RNA polymerase sigma-70 factor (ECF subfamily)